MKLISLGDPYIGAGIHWKGCVVKKHTSTKR